MKTIIPKASNTFLAELMRMTPIQLESKLENDRQRLDKAKKRAKVYQSLYDEIVAVKNAADDARTALKLCEIDEDAIILKYKKTDKLFCDG